MIGFTVMTTGVCGCATRAQAPLFLVPNKIEAREERA